MKEKDWYLVFVSDRPRRVVIRRLAERLDRALEFTYNDGNLGAKVLDSSEVDHYDDLELFNPKSPIFTCIGIVDVEGIRALYNFY